MAQNFEIITSKQSKEMLLYASHVYNSHFEVELGPGGYFIIEDVKGVYNKQKRCLTVFKEHLHEQDE